MRRGFCDEPYEEWDGGDSPRRSRVTRLADLLEGEGRGDSSTPQPSSLPDKAEGGQHDAKVNSAINAISNTSFYAGDMKDVLSDEFVALNGKPDVIILDPPRAGVDERVLEVIMRAAPERIVYVSCNPATQARDLAILDSMYEVVAVQPVDMFPHTHHVENVVKLVRRA